MPDAPVTTTTTPPGTPGDAGAAPAGGDKGSTQTPPSTGDGKTTLVTGETKTTEGQNQPAGEPPKGDTAAQGEIQITVPKGVEFDQGMLDGFKGLAKEIGIKSEDAQKVADWYFKSAQEFVQRSQVAQEQQVVKWAEEAKADPVIGGAAFEGNLKTAQQALRQFGDPALTKLLNETGLGNNKVMIGLFARIGKAISEDRMPKGPVAAADGQKQEVPLEQTLYPTMYPPT